MSYPSAVPAGTPTPRRLNKLQLRRIEVEATEQQRPRSALLATVLLERAHQHGALARQPIVTGPELETLANYAKAPGEPRIHARAVRHAIAILEGIGALQRLPRNAQREREFRMPELWSQIVSDGSDAEEAWEALRERRRYADKMKKRRRRNRLRDASCPPSDGSLSHFELSPNAAKHLADAADATLKNLSPVIHTSCQALDAAAPPAFDVDLPKKAKNQPTGTAVRPLGAQRRGRAADAGGLVLVLPDDDRR